MKAITGVEYHSEQDIADIEQAKRLLQGVMRRNIPKVFTFADRIPSVLTADGITFLAAPSVRK